MTDKTRKSLKKHLFVYSVLIYPLVLFAVLWVGVNFNSIIMAFQNFDAYGNASFAGFGNFVKFFEFISSGSSDITIKTSIINSLKNYFIGLIGFPISFVIAYCLYKKIRLYKIYRFIVMIPQIVSGFILTLVFHKFVENALPTIMRAFGVANFPNLLDDARYTYGTSLFFSIWSGMATTILLYTSSLNSIDQSIIESAKMDGANFFQEMWYICLPMIGGIISTGFIASISGIFTAEGPLVAFWEFGAPPEVMNVGYYFTSQVMLHQNDWSVFPMLSAMGLFFTIITVPLVFSVRKLFNKILPEV